MTAFLTDLKRTHTCGELRADHIGEEVVLMGWVQTTRDHGGTIFIDVRDRYGITQVRFDEGMMGGGYGDAERLRPEWTFGVRGKVVSRGENTNPHIPTGAVEILADAIGVFSESKTPPFEIKDELDTAENKRLEYRFLDLRRRPLQDKLILRSMVNRVTRNCLSENGFLELETPILTKSTPEGARDYLVPSRVYPGQFFALPQSPQLFKQLFLFISC